jgi:hypothetical protein
MAITQGRVDSCTSEHVAGANALCGRARTIGRAREVGTTFVGHGTHITSGLPGEMGRGPSQQCA